MIELLIRALHFIAIMVLFSALLTQYLVTTNEITLGRIKKLAVLNAIYFSSIVLVLITGFLLWFYVASVPEFYSSNWVFHLKLGLFTVVVLISLFPTAFIHRNRKSEQATISVPGYIIAIIRVELLTVLLMPGTAVAMAKGFGSG